MKRYLCIFAVSFCAASAPVFGVPDGSGMTGLYKKIGPQPVSEIDTPRIKQRKLVHHIVASPLLLVASPFVGASDGLSAGLTDLSTAESGGDRTVQSVLLLPKCVGAAGSYLVRTGYAVVRTPMMSDGVARASASKVAASATLVGGAKPTATVVTEASGRMAPVAGAAAVNSSKSQLAVPVYSTEPMQSSESAWTRAFKSGPMGHKL